MTAAVKRETAKQAVYFALVALVLLARRPSTLFGAQFWAEDGFVFFAAQLQDGFWRALTTPYSGYIHVLPRLIAAVLSPLPVLTAPAAYGLVSLLIDAVCLSAFAWPCFRKIVASDHLRLACCLVAAATIHFDEVVGTLCNIQWPLAILSLLLLAVEGFDWPILAVQIPTAFSAPASLLFVPIVAWQALRRRGAARLRACLHLAALLWAAKILYRLSAAESLRHFNSVLVSTLTAAVSRCIMSPLFGNWSLAAGTDIGFIAKFFVVSAVAVALLTYTALSLRKSPRWCYLAVAVYVALGSIAMVMSGRRLALLFVQNVDGARHVTAERYFFIGACLFVFMVALMLETLLPAKALRLTPLLLAALFIGGIVTNFHIAALPDMQWPRAAAQIEAWKQTRQGGLVIPINPPPNIQIKLHDNR